jgi:hypothetical protein
MEIFGGIPWFDFILGLAGSVVSALLLASSYRAQRRLGGRYDRLIVTIKEDLEEDLAEGQGARTEAIREAIKNFVSEEKQESTETRIGRLVASLHESQRLITELQAEIDVKAAAVARLQAEEEQSRQLAALRQEEAAAVNRLISTTLNAAHDNLRRELEQERDHLRGNLSHLQLELEAMQRKGRRDQWLFFGAGVVLSIPIGIMINILF